MAHQVCSECGARNTLEADACDLCGASLRAPHVDEAAAAESTAGEAEGGPPMPSEPGDRETGGGAFCNQCGWRNPPGARYCSRCGTRLQDLGGAPDRHDVSPARPLPSRVERLPEGGSPAAEGTPGVATGLSRQVGLAVAAAVLLVAALYLITVVSRDRPTPPSASTAPAAPSGSVLTPEPLPQQQADEVAALQRQIDQAEGEARLERQRALVDLLVSFGRPDHAALVQQEVAEAVGTAEAWRRAGNYYFDWMTALPEAQKGGPAARAVAAFEHVIEQDPDDLDVRADMAWAFQYDPQNSMQAITLNNAVLERDPDHVQANFNRALFLMRINRLDQAVEQLERVKGLVDEGSPVYTRADEYIEVIHEVRSGRGGS